MKKPQAPEPLKAGDLQVWWVPQPPHPGFTFRVPDVATGAAVLDRLASYDLVCHPEERFTTVAERLAFVKHIPDQLVREAVEAYEKYLQSRDILQVSDNAGGLQVFEKPEGEDGEFIDWYDDDTNEDVDHFLREKGSAEPMTVEQATAALAEWRKDFA